MIRRITILSLVLLCGCATGSRMTLNHYRWSPEEFEIVFPSAGWRFANSLTSNGEHHEIFERRTLFYTDHSEQVSITSYLPTRGGTGSAKPLEVFANVTNFLSQHYLLSVTVIETTNDTITWEWSGPSKGKLPTQSGVEKIVRGDSGTYRLRYVSGSISLTPTQRRVWIPVIQNAKLSQRAS